MAKNSQFCPLLACYQCNAKKVPNDEIFEFTCATKKAVERHFDEKFPVIRFCQNIQFLRSFQRRLEL